MATKKNIRRAIKKNNEGLAFFDNWDIEDAISSFEKAVVADPDNPEYHLNLARAHARSGDFGEAMNSLGEYLRTETNENMATRFERMFSSALDDVESCLIDNMAKLELTVQHTGKAIQMWLEYRITIGRRPLRVPKPELWAAALAYAVIKVNFLDKKRAEVAEIFEVQENSLKKKYDELVGTLDLMPADYRYYTKKENPLDKLVEVAQMLEDLDRRFRTD